MSFVSSSVGFPGLSVKSVPVSGDLLLIADSAAGNALKQITVGTLPFAPAGGAAFVNVTSATQAMAINTRYFVNYTGGQCVLTLPTVASTTQNSFVEIIGGAANTVGFQIAQLATQLVLFLAGTTTTGTGGSLTSPGPYDSIMLMCTQNSGFTTWTVTEVCSQGGFAGV